MGGDLGQHSHLQLDQYSTPALYYIVSLSNHTQMRLQDIYLWIITSHYTIIIISLFAHESTWHIKKYIYKNNAIL